VPNEPAAESMGAGEGSAGAGAGTEAAGAAEAAGASGDAAALSARVRAGETAAGERGRRRGEATRAPAGEAAATTGEAEDGGRSGGEGGGGVAGEKITGDGASGDGIDAGEPWAWCGGVGNERKEIEKLTRALPIVSRALMPCRASPRRFPWFPPLTLQPSTPTSHQCKDSQRFPASWCLRSIGQRVDLATGVEMAMVQVGRGREGERRRMRATTCTTNCKACTRGVNVGWAGAITVHPHTSGLRVRIAKLGRPKRRAHAGAPSVPGVVASACAGAGEGAAMEVA